MNKAQKQTVIDELKEKFSNTNFFYLADSSSLSVENVNALRRKFFAHDIELRVAKNTLIKKALESVEGVEYDEALYNVLKGPTAIIFADAANLPARMIKEYRKENKALEKPTVKAAYIDTAIFLGDDQLEALAALKSKEELLGEIVNLLQSPATNVISALNSSGGKLAGILKTLSEKSE